VPRRDRLRIRCAVARAYCTMGRPEMARPIAAEVLDQARGGPSATVLASPVLDCETIADPAERDAIWSLAAEVYARSGELQRALHITEQIEAAESILYSCRAVLRSCGGQPGTQGMVPFAVLELCSRRSRGLLLEVAAAAVAALGTFLGPTALWRALDVVASELRKAAGRS